MCRAGRSRRHGTSGGFSGIYFVAFLVITVITLDGEKSHPDGENLPQLSTSRRPETVPGPASSMRRVRRERRGPQADAAGGRRDARKQGRLPEREQPFGLG